MCLVLLYQETMVSVQSVPARKGTVASLTPDGDVLVLGEVSPVNHHAR